MNHDLTGVNGLIKVHRDKVNQIKFSTRVDNEIYLREHPELEFILENFLIKLLEDRPPEIFKYAGSHFNSTDFRALYKKQINSQEKDNKNN